MQRFAALLPQAAALLGKPARERRLQGAQIGQPLLRPLRLVRHVAQRQQGQVLLVGQRQLGVDHRQLVEIGGDLQGFLIGRLVVEHQLPKDLVDAVELLQAGGAVEQGEGVGADLEVALQLGEVRGFGAKYVQAIGVFFQLAQGARAAVVVLFQPGV